MLNIETSRVSRRGVQNPLQRFIRKQQRNSGFEMEIPYWLNRTGERLKSRLELLKRWRKEW
jgi:hypothetical protein